MKSDYCLWLGVATAVLSSSVDSLWANSAPVVTNVTAHQRTDGSKLVDIYYNLTDADGDASTVTVLASGDYGATWIVPITAVTGHIGTGIAPGTDRHIVWDCATDLPGAFGSQYRVRVCADDGHGPGGMAFIPGGEFQMGDTFNEGYTDERPVHPVYLIPYCIDIYEVTNQQYADALNWAWAQGGLITVTSGVVYKYNSGTSYPFCDTTTSSSYSGITWNGSTFGVVAGKEDHPMVMVSWYGSVAYANWRSGLEGKTPCYDLSSWTCNFGSGYRLPTEAEWEKAARGGTAAHRFPWSDTDTIQHARCNYRSYWSNGVPDYPYDTSPIEGYHPCWGSAGYPYTSPVGFFDGSLRYKTEFNWPGNPTSYQTANGANGYGLHDIAGNVCEWCNDWYSSWYYSISPGSNPMGPGAGTYRVARGGCWGSIAISCRVAFRFNGSAPGTRHTILGFRCAAGTE